MLTDHSKTYQLNDVRNIAHVMRLRSILKTLRRRVTGKVDSYADFGCSNGYITSQVGEQLRIPRINGFDHSDNVAVGAQLHPHIQFSRFDLNVLHEKVPKYRLVTCFETIEHVGNMESALDTVYRSRAPDGYLLITVPIEIGWIGFFKYLLKRFVFRYELPLSCTDWQYTRALIAGTRIGQFRLPAQGYGTHFGFDYRDVDDWLSKKVGPPFQAWNAGTTRFYFIGPTA